MYEEGGLSSRGEKKWKERNSQSQDKESKREKLRTSATSQKASQAQDGPQCKAAVNIPYLAEQTSPPRGQGECDCRGVSLETTYLKNVSKWVDNLKYLKCVFFHVRVNVCLGCRNQRVVEMIVKGKRGTCILSL